MNPSSVFFAIPVIYLVAACVSARYILTRGGGR